MTKVLVVGQTPPPYHGQAIMIQMLVDGPIPDVKLKHVRMQFSENIGEIGKVRFGKILHLFSVLAQIVWCRIRFRPDILYYPPSGPNRVPLIRDAIILLTVRWMFRATVFHFQASGCSELIPKLPSLLKWFIQKALHAPDVAIELSEFAASDGSFLGAKRVVRIPNAAADEFERYAELRTSNETATPRVLYLGTVCEGKGVTILIEACRILCESNVPFYLDIVGSFESESYRDFLHTEITRLGLNDHITLHGQKVGPAKWQMFAQADVFCFPSHYQSEAFPCVLLEAMSFRLPIVSTVWRGIPSIVSSGESGFLAPTHNPQAIADHLMSLLRCGDLRQKMGAAGRHRFEQEFTQAKFLEKMRNVFLSLTSKEHPTREKSVDALVQNVIS
ncbi:glycosyltransferase [Pirellulaceae bacterium SH501]